MNKKLVIIGNGPTREYVSNECIHCDVWMFNNHALYSGRSDVTAVFEMHPDALENPKYHDDYKDWLRKEHRFPIYMHEETPGIPSSKRYPLEIVKSRIGGSIFLGKERIQERFSSSFPYALALAIAKPYPRIDIFGMDLDKGVYPTYKPDVFFWLGVASQNNITVVFPQQSTLIKPTLYPFR